MRIAISALVLLLAAPAQAAHCPHGQWYLVHKHKCIPKSRVSLRSVKPVKPKPEDIMHGDDGRPALHDEQIYPPPPTLPDAFVHSIMNHFPHVWTTR